MLCIASHGAPHVFHAYSDAGCTTANERGTFNATLYAPTGFSHNTTHCQHFPCDENASWTCNSSTTGAIDYELQAEPGINPNWWHRHTVPPTTDTSLSHSGSAAANGVRVRAFRCTGGVTIYSAWVQQCEGASVRQ